MPIDARLALTGNPLQIDNPLDVYAKGMNIAGLQKQNRLADLAFGQKKSEIASANALSGAYAAAVKPDGTVDREKLRTGLAAAGQGAAIPGVNTGFSAEDKAALEARDAELKHRLGFMSYVSQRLSAATAENLAAIRQEIAASDPNLGPQAAANIPQTFDPVVFKGLIDSGIPIIEQHKQAALESAAKLAQANQEANRAVVIRGQDLASADRRAAIAAKPGAGGKPVNLSTTAQKELFEADDTIQSGKNVSGLLDQALKLNDKAYSGLTSDLRATAMSNIPFVSPPEGANATVDMNNIILGQALESLKATFGGMPTEGERKILIDIQASVDKKPEQRKAILERAKEAVERRVKFNISKAKALREGTYMTEGPTYQESADTDQDDIFSQADAILGGM